MYAVCVLTTSPNILCNKFSFELVNISTYSISFVIPTSLSNRNCPFRLVAEKVFGTDYGVTKLVGILTLFRSVNISVHLLWDRKVAKGRIKLCCNILLDDRVHYRYWDHSTHSTCQCCMIRTQSD